MQSQILEGQHVLCLLDWALAIDKLPRRMTVERRLTLITDQYCAWPNIVFLRYLQYSVFFEQRATSAAQRTVTLHDNTLLSAECRDLCLREVWVIFYLVCGWSDGGVLEQLLQERNAVIRNANGLRLSGFQQLLHVLPGLEMREFRVEIS